MKKSIKKIVDDSKELEEKIDKPLERFIIKPTGNPHFGRTVTKELEFDEYNNNKTLHQTLKDLVFTTTINKEYITNMGIKVKEKSEYSMELKVGMVLVWNNEEDGYILPKYPMGTFKEVADEMMELHEAYYGTD